MTTSNRSSARRSKFWLVMYSSACQRVHRFTRLPTLALPATAPICGLAKCGPAWKSHLRDHRIGVDAHIELFVESATAKFSASALPPFGAQHGQQAGRDLLRIGSRATSEVRSVDPSSITMMRRCG